MYMLTIHNSLCINNNKMLARNIIMQKNQQYNNIMKNKHILDN